MYGELLYFGMPRHMRMIGGQSHGPQVTLLQSIPPFSYFPRPVSVPNRPRPTGRARAHQAASQPACMHFHMKTLRTIDMQLTLYYLSFMDR